VRTHYHTDRYFMENLNIPELILPPAKKDDPRVFELLGRDLKVGSVPKVVILGFPSDRGAILNGGRAGSAAGPKAIREQLYRLCPDPHHFEPFAQLLRSTRDLGDLKVTDDLAHDLEQITRTVATLIAGGSFVIILGGSHDLSLAHWRAYKSLGREGSIINMDAHPDMREPVEGQTHSGSPFFEALNDREQPLSQYDVWGLRKWSCSKAQIDLLKEKNCDYHFVEQVSPELVQQLYTAKKSNRIASFDLDAIDQAYCPGVSAPSVGGLSPALYIQAMLEVGRNSSFSSLDLVELNPQFDRDNQSARLAAVGLWHLYLGLCER